jgi:hypothetical protein
LHTAAEPLQGPPRDAALDALRGLAVLGMVLSGSLGFGGALPGWMFHAQLPPPTHRFMPTLPGITWVDLVFPMFLFALGAALPLALRRQSLRAVAGTALRRGALLLYFALFTQQFKAVNLGGAELGATGTHTLSLLAFALLGLQLVRRVPTAIKLMAWGLAAGLWWHIGFDPKRNDIILVVLAVMACLGSLLWASTQTRPQWRWWLLPAVVAVMLAPPDAWTRALTWTPAPWAYQFGFLKYLLIVVPGMAVGEWLARAERPAPERLLPVLALVLVLVNLTLLYARETALNALLSAALLAWGAVRAQRAGGFAAQAWPLLAALVLAGLLLEPLQGGIRKDPSTFSYQVLTAGLSLALLMALQGLRGPLVGYLATHGRNPLLAYVAGSLCVLPLLHLTGLYTAWSGLNGTAATALAKGLVFTGTVSLLTLAATRAGWVWRA